MRLRLATSPWWVQGLVYGVFFGAAMTVFQRVQLGHWLPAVVGGVLGGVFFGVFMGLFSSRRNRRMLGGLESLSLQERRIVARAAWRGPAPEDLQLRDDARALVQRQLGELVRHRWWTILVFSAGIVLYVVEALTRTWWWWMAAGLFLVFLGLTLATPSLLRRRLEVLRTADQVGAPGRPDVTGAA